MEKGKCRFGSDCETFQTCNGMVHMPHYDSGHPPTGEAQASGKSSNHQIIKECVWCYSAQTDFVCEKCGGARLCNSRDRHCFQEFHESLHLSSLCDSDKIDFDTPAI